MIPNERPKPAPANVVAGFAQLAVQLATLGIIPKGYLTIASAALQVVSGVGLLAGVLAGVLSSPDPVTMGDVSGPLTGALLLIGNGAGTMGLGRKIEAVEKDVRP